MSYGDEIMAAGQAAALAARVGRPVAIVGADGRPRRSEVWDGNPAIDPASPVTLVNGPRARPYLMSLSRDAGAVFTDWRARDEPGRLYLTADEMAYGSALRERLGPYVVVEPGLARNANPNKQWGRDRWQALARRVTSPRLVQLSEGHTPDLYWAEPVRPATFRLACAVLAHAAGAVLPEGGLHHAAAALGVPAVVIFGGHTSPETTGYPAHVNLYPDLPGSPCGQWRPCEHCRRAMAAITVDAVAAALERILER